MHELERVIEDLAQTVQCPVCHAEPSAKCRDWSARLKSITVQSYSHLGRLKVARGEPL